MKIKRYEGVNEQTVIQQVKDELGPHAMIVSIKSVRAQGLLGVFRKPRIEVMAAYDADNREDGGGAAPERRAQGPAVPNVEQAKNVQQNQAQNHAQSQAQNDAQKENQAFAAGLKDAYKDRIIEEQAEKIKLLESNVASTQEMLSRLSGKLSVARHKTWKTEKRYKNNIIQAIFEVMIEQSVSEQVAAAVLEGLDVGPSPEDSIDIEDIIKMVYANIIKIIGESSSDYEDHRARDNALIEASESNMDMDAKSNSNSRRRTRHSNNRNNHNKKKKTPFVALFLGPTGVGKTTTIAKLSADFVLNQQVNLSLISADTYRIAAVEQLRTYAEILGVDLGVAYNPEDLIKQLEGMDQDKDVVFVDTAGRSHKHADHMQEMIQFLDVCKDYQKYLVLSLTTKFEDMLEIVDIYAQVTDFKLIFTKLDETKTVGSVLNLCYATGKSVSYITFGQNVPNDIRRLCPEEIARAILIGV